MTLPGIPSIYYGGEWGIEGERTRTCDDMLRPAIHIETRKAALWLTDALAALGQLHGAHDASTTAATRNCCLPTASTPSRDTEQLL